MSADKFDPEKILRNVLNFMTVTRRQLISYINSIQKQLGWDLLEILVVWTFILYVSAKIFRVLRVMSKDGYKKSILSLGLHYARKLPFVRKHLDKELGKAKKSLDDDVNKHRSNKTVALPEKGWSVEQIKDHTKKWFDRDYGFYKDHKISGCLYYNESDPTIEFAKEVAKQYLYQNPLHFDLFPSVAQMDAEVISMVKNLYNGDSEACGIVTSGGTESIMLAMLCYREWGRAHGITEPEIVAPRTAHVAFEKAAFYYHMRVVWVDINIQTGVVDPRKMKKAITKNTVCLIGSCPNYPYGTVDDLDALGKIAKQHGIGLHSDCCLGGFIAPFAHHAGVNLPTFDFRNPGVTSISVDPHKYGCAPKGVSVVLFRNRELRSRTLYSSGNWPGGIYATPTMAGSRGGGPTAGAWAVLLRTGYEGYKEKAVKIIEGVRATVKELSKIPQLRLVGNPEIGTFSFVARDKGVECFEILDELSKKGWHAAALQYPPGIHLSVTSYNLPELPRYVEDFKQAVEIYMAKPKGEKLGGVAQLYGSSAKLPNELVKEGAKLIIDSLLDI